MSERATGPLAGVRVIECAQVVAGPTCGYMLADLGADVIKVERAPRGDDVRRMTPPSIEGESAAFMMLNRNKRAIALDLKQAAAKEAFLRLVRTADILVENYRPGAMERMGLGYDDLKAENPGLVYATISGFGRTGPYAGRGGYDLVAQAMSGLMSITGEGPGRPPVKVGSPIADFAAGILAALGIVSAYSHRLKTGEGQYLETSLFEAGDLGDLPPDGDVPRHRRAAAAARLGASAGRPYQAYQTADGWITVGAGNDANWPRLAEVLGAPELDQGSRFSHHDDRMNNLAELNEALAPLFRAHGSDAFSRRSRERGVPAGPVLDIGQMTEDPQTAARDRIMEVEHSRLGAVRTLGPPIKLAATPANVRRGAPVLGEHSAEILARIRLRRRGNRGHGGDRGGDPRLILHAAKSMEPSHSSRTRAMVGASKKPSMRAAMSATSPGAAAAARHQTLSCSPAAPSWRASASTRHLANQVMVRSQVSAPHGHQPGPERGRQVGRDRVEIGGVEAAHIVMGERGGAVGVPHRRGVEARMRHVDGGRAVERHFQVDEDRARRPAAALDQEIAGVGVGGAEPDRLPRGGVARGIAPCPGELLGDLGPPAAGVAPARSK